MKKEIIASCTSHETRIALLEDNRLAELWIERPSLGAAKIVGNVYKGCVENVLPGISSAFIDVGLGKNAYLYITDIVADNGTPPIQTPDLGVRGQALRGRQRNHLPKSIDEVLTKGKDIMVQVTKESIGNKGMKVTMDISLPGRHLVYVPLDSSVGMSKQIQEQAERDRLKNIITQLAPPGGVIVRTEAEGASERDLRREMRYLMRLWDNVQKRFESARGPGLLHRELGLTLQVARDILNEDVNVFLIDSRSEYESVREFMDMLAPELVERVRHYEGKTPIFTAFKIEPAIVKLLQQRIDLSSGGYIIIQEAESLCAIDVNTGRFTGETSQEETVTITNIEAAEEIARQLRLRNIGGIIVIDFIDMRRKKNQNRVVEAIREATRYDRAKIKILPLTRLGLVEMTRERKRESLLSLICEPCTECGGSGSILSKESVYIKLCKEITNMTQGRLECKVRMQLSPETAAFVRERQGSLEKHLRRPVIIQDDAAISGDDYRIVLEE